ncbi:MAG: CBS domain-containing protein, partial [Synergistaceae bacterium]|nr:CBS domain-containing protein [Synergistaceae bacterium]
MQLITSHLNTDFDSLASMIAIQKLYPDALICPPGSMSRKVRDFMSKQGANFSSRITKPKKIPLDEVSMLIVVDTRSLSRIGTFAELAGKPDVEVHVYDHHPKTADDIPAVKFMYEPIGAATTMILEQLLLNRKDITPEEATLFAIGIYDDTGAFTYETTTERDIAAVSYLRELGADLSGVLAQVESGMSSEDKRLLDSLAENIREKYINGAKVCLTWAETENYVQGLSVFVNRLKEYCDSHVTIAVVHNGGKKTNIIARSVEGVLNVKEFLAPYGGSGHYQAGSATIESTDAQTLLAEIEHRLSSAITPMVKVSDIMTSPVIAVGPEAKVDEGYRTMLRFGVKSLPVINENGEVEGIMTRKDLDKAHIHGLDRANISDFMTRGVISLSAEASIDEAHRMMATYGFEKMPVLDKNGKIAGTISRAGLLKALYHAGQFAGDEKSRDSTGFLWVENVSHLMEDSFSLKTLSLLRRVGAKAHELGMKAYLVGGTVRDILMGVSNTDIDISVEGDAEKLVMSWDEPGCKATLHGRYKTGTITFPDGEKVDVATARREFYEYAAATPTVQNSSLKQDLSRRDFTVNAMSISLSDDDWGTLTDNYGGRADLKDKLLKILHNLSFVEDPSRVLRGIRLEQRLNMKFEGNTMRLLKSAVKGGLLDLLSTTRIRAELELNAKESCFRKIVMRMQELGVWNALFTGMHVSPAVYHRLRILEHFMNQMSVHGINFKGMEWLVKMAVVFTDSKPEVRFSAMDRMNLNPNERENLMKCFTQWPNVEKFCANNKTVKNSEAYLFFKDYGAVPLVYWLTCLKTREARRLVVEYLELWIGYKGHMTGKDLQKLGLKGKEIGEALALIKLAVIDGEIKSLEDEIQYVRKNIIPS